MTPGEVYATIFTGRVILLAGFALQWAATVAAFWWLTRRSERRLDGVFEDIKALVEVDRTRGELTAKKVDRGVEDITSTVKKTAAVMTEQAAEVVKTVQDAAPGLSGTGLANQPKGT